jgi:hypothetical protein
MTQRISPIEAAIAEAFPESDTATIVELLNSYGTQPYENERERVHLAVLKLSEGNLEKLQSFLAIAKEDYRDILAWVSRPIPTDDETARDSAAVNDILNRWGDK